MSPGHHPVETVLEATDLGLLVHVDGSSQLAALDLCHRVDDVADGSEIDRATRMSARNPRATDTKVITTTGTTTDADVGTNQP